MSPVPRSGIVRRMATPERKAWTRDELLLAISLYCRTPFGRIHMRNPEIIELAAVLGRTPGAVSLKLANFAAIDPSLGRRGASNFSRLDREVWNEFFQDWNGMAYDSQMKHPRLRETVLAWDDIAAIPPGRTRDAVVQARVNQDFFRQMVLAQFDEKCCITGLPVKELLVASHIVPWARDEKNRTNPRNGLCLNSLHDRAFDTGLITLDRGFRVVLSSRLRTDTAAAPRFFRDYEGRQIIMPRRFLPDQDLLEYHRANVFRG